MDTPMIFHAPYALGRSDTAATVIPPVRMLHAFKEAGYRPYVIAGTGRQRQRRLQQLRQEIKNGTPFAFAYSESATTPSAFADRSNFPLHLQLDRDIFHTIADAQIPSGVFYHDVDWMFPHYIESLPLPSLTAPLMRALYRRDIDTYNRYVDTVFVPSLGYVPHIKGLEVDNVVALPPGMTPVPTPEPKLAATSSLNLLYVGPVGGSGYEILTLLQAVAQVPQCHLVICTHEGQDRTLLAAADQLPNVTVQVASQTELPQYYTQADICMLFMQPDEYRAFAAPNRLFEYLQYGCPVIASADTYAGDYVTSKGVGWVIPYDCMELVALLIQLLTHRDGVRVKSQAARTLAAGSTWVSRAHEVAKVLGSPKTWGNS